MPSFEKLHEISGNRRKNESAVLKVNKSLDVKNGVRGKVKNGKSYVDLLKENARERYEDVRIGYCR